MNRIKAMWKILFAEHYFVMSKRKEVIFTGHKLPKNRSGFYKELTDAADKAYEQFLK